LFHPKGFDRNAPAIGAQGDETILVGPQNARVMSRQPLQHQWMRMMEGILESIGNYSVSGRYSVQKRIDAGCIAAVVPNLEDVGA